MDRLKILWLSHFVPYPPSGGCFQRNFNLIRRIAERHDLYLIALRHKANTHPEPETAEARRQLDRCCRSIQVVDISGATRGVRMLERAIIGMSTGHPFSVTVYESNAVRDAIRSAVASVPFDVVHFDTIGLAQYLDIIGDLPSTVTHHGAEGFMIGRRIAHESSLVRRLFFRFEHWALSRYERQMCGRFDVNITVSDDDAAILRQIAPDAVFATVANGVDVKSFRPLADSNERRIVFAGRLDQYSNRDGVLHFVERAWPLIATQFPDAVFDIIGHNPPDALRRLAAGDGRVRVHGFVPDIRPYFDRAAVALCPVRDGGGTRIKVLDALAMGIPLVSTSIGCEGIAVVPEQHVLIADTPADFARQIGRAFTDPALRLRLASHGRRLVETRYSWDALSDQLTDQYRAIARIPRAAMTA